MGKKDGGWLKKKRRRLGVAHWELGISLGKAGLPLKPRKEGKKLSRKGGEQDP